jgi:uncharacterized protein (TIGR02145 family)
MRNINKITVVILLFILFCSCVKEKTTLPILTTTAVTNITETTAQSGGNITDDGNDVILSRGIVWSNIPQPTLELNTGYAIEGSGLGIFIVDISGLEGNTNYYVRAFASNKEGTAYGNQQAFLTLLMEKASVFTAAPKDITTSSAIVGGNITDDGGSPVFERGVYWSTYKNPEVMGTKLQIGSGTGSFSYQMLDLSVSQTYYIKAFAINNKGETLGDEISFTTQVIDVDGNIYNAVTIGTQVWMIENLKVTHYRNGDPVSNIIDNKEWMNISSTGAYCDYNNFSGNGITYGKLYTWYTISDSRNIAPVGWHVPTDEEWATLTTYLGGLTVAAGKLKESGTTHWNSPNTGATNESGFKALPGGQRHADGTFSSIENSGYWWTSTETSSNGIGRRLDYDADYVHKIYSLRWEGYSIRCIKDN